MRSRSRVLVRRGGFLAGGVAALLALLAFAALSPAAECPCPEWMCVDPAAAAAAKAAKKAAMAARGSPPRLTALVDRLPDCVRCVETAPDDFHILFEYDRAAWEAEHGTPAPRYRMYTWTREEERRAREQVAAGLLKSYRIVYASRACECCGDERYDARADWDPVLEINTDLALNYVGAEGLGEDPSDLTTLPEQWRRPDALRMPPLEQDPPVRLVQTLCQPCKPLEEERNKYAHWINDLNRRIAQTIRSLRLLDQRLAQLGAEAIALERLADAPETAAQIEENESLTEAYRSDRRRLLAKLREQYAARDEHRASMDDAMARLGECERTQCPAAKPQTAVGLGGAAPAPGEAVAAGPEPSGGTAPETGAPDSGEAAPADAPGVTRGAGGEPPVTPPRGGPGTGPALTGAPDLPVVPQAGEGESPPAGEGETPPAVGLGDPIPADDADVQAVTAAAQAVAQAAGNCTEVPCPVVDCTQANALMQALVDAEADLDAMYAALIEASDDAFAHLQSLISQSTLTTEQLAMAQEAQAVQEYLTRIGTILLDLASITGFWEKFAKGDFAKGNLAERIDATYEMIKDAESLLDTAADAYVETPGTGPVSDVTGAAVGAMGGDALADALGVEGGSEALGSKINDLKSTLNDAKDALDALREGKTPAEAVGKILGRFLKSWSNDIMEERKKHMDALVADIGAEAGAGSSSYENWTRTATRRNAVEDALAAVRAAREALAACMAKHCTAASLTRPQTPGFDGWGTALRYYNGRLAEIAASLQGGLEVKNICPGEGDTGVALGGGGGGLISVPGGAGTPVPPKHEVEAACPACQPIADAIALILDEIEYLRADRAAIEDALRQAEELRQRLDIAERHKNDLGKSVRAAERGVSEGTALGINVASSLRITLRELQGKLADARREVSRLQREIERLEARKDELEQLDQRIAALNERRRELRAELAACEEARCREGEDLARFFGPLFDVELEQVFHVSGNNPFDARDPLAEDADRIGRTAKGAGPGTPPPASSPLPGSPPPSSPPPAGGSNNPYLPNVGTYSGDNGCGFGSTTLDIVGDTIVTLTLPPNGTVSFDVDAATENANSQLNTLILFGVPGHKCQIFGRSDTDFTLFCFEDPGPGGSCLEGFDKL